MSYNRFAKTPDFKSGDEGEVRLQSSADIEQRSGCKLGIKKTADFQSAEVYKPGSEPSGTGFHNYYENEDPSATVRLILALGGPRNTEGIFLDVVRMKPSIDEILLANERLRAAEYTYLLLSH